jgi:hypothetical protein
MKQTLSRRSIVKTFGLLSIVAPLSTLIDWSKAFAQTATKLLIDMTGKKRKDPTNKAAVALASGFKYIADAKKEKRLEGIEKASAKGTKFSLDKQFCHNCQYAPEAQKQGDGYACLLIANVLVHSDGWCKQWMPRQDA